MNILIVDDSMLIRKIIKNDLEVEFAGNAFLTATNGADAMEIVKNEDISVVFLDWNMPKLNGLEFVKQAKKDESLKDMIIIMVTSEAAKYHVIEALEAGVDEYLVKPVSASLLRKIVRKYI